MTMTRHQTCNNTSTPVFLPSLRWGQNLLLLLKPISSARNELVCGLNQRSKAIKGVILRKGFCNLLLLKVFWLWGRTPLTSSRSNFDGLKRDGDVAPDELNSWPLSRLALPRRPYPSYPQCHREPNTRHVLGQGRFRHQHGDHPSGTPLRPGLRLGAQLDLPLRPEIRPEVPLRDPGGHRGQTGLDRPQEERAPEDPHGRLRGGRDQHPGHRMPDLPRGVCRRGQGPGSSQMPPRFSCHVYRHMAALPLLVPNLPAVFARPSGGSCLNT